MTTEPKKRTTGTHDEIAGKAHEAKGTIKEKVGGITNDPDFQEEGQSEKTGGKVEQAVGKVKKAVGK